MAIEKRYERQQDLYDASGVTLAIIGVGAVGRNAALQAAAIGVGSITIVDFDNVGPENLSSQGFKEIDIGLPKVQAVLRELKQINSEIDLMAIDDEYKPAQTKSDVVFSCVDNITVRRTIFETQRKKCKLFIDCRMSAEVCRVIKVDMSRPAECAHYESTLFAEGEAFEQRCTSKSTIYCAAITAALMISELTKYLRGLEGPTDATLYIPPLQLIRGDRTAPAAPERPENELEIDIEAVIE